MNYSDDSLDSLSDLPRRDVAESPTFTVTDLLTSLGERNQDAQYLVTKGNDLVLLLQQYPYIKEDLVLSAFGHRLQTLLTHQKKEVVATGYRICRYVIYDATSIQALISLKLDILIIISLSKSPAFDIEREQALKLVRKFYETPGGAQELTRGITNAILAIAEQVDDRLRGICIETIAELCLIRPDLVSPHTLVQFVVDGPYEFSSMCATIILAFLNEPALRQYIDGIDMLKIVSPFTDFPVKGHLNNDKLQTSAYIISRFMKNLAGFHGLCINDNEALKDLIHCLSYPVQSVVSKLLDVFLDVLMINPLSKKPPAGHSNKMVLVPLKLENEFPLHTHYLSLIVVKLIQCGIGRSLGTVVNTTPDESVRTKAVFLLTEIFNMTSSLVPDELTVDLQDELACFAGHTANLLDSKTEFMIEKLTRKSNKGRMLLGMEKLKISDNFMLNSKTTTNKTRYNIDDATLKQAITDTKVLSTKSFFKWKCDVISELFAGPFTNGRRLDEINRTTKFVKRLLSFYRPFKHKFSTMKKNKQSLRFTKLGCDIMEGLLASPEGVRILKESKIMPQVAECLAQLDPYSGLVAKDQLFSQQRMEGTLVGGYLNMLGVLSSNEQGLSLLSRWKLFSIIHHISDHPFKREDLLLMFMEEMDFKKSGHMRILLSKFLHSENRNLKHKATEILSDLIGESECNSFICEMLIDQLYEQDEEISEQVIKILSEYCDVSPANMDQIVEFEPSVNILRRCGEQGEALLLKFMSTTAGFEYLRSQGFVDEEFDNWIGGERYMAYALEIESLLMSLDKDFERTGTAKRVELPSHFFGALVKTEEGFNVIVHSGIMTELVNNIRYYATSLDKYDEIPNLDHVKLSACMWAIGMISTSELGIETLDVNGCIEDLVQIATSSPVINIRGSAFYVLGLISKTNQGIEILDEFGWSTKMNVFNQSIGVTLPRDINTFIGWDTERGEDPEAQWINYDLMNEIDTDDEILKKLMRVIGSFCNQLNLKIATKELMSLAKQSPEYFEDPDVFFLVLRYMEMFRYKQPVRKTIIETFTENRRMLDVLVKRDKRRIKELVGH